MSVGSASRPVRRARVVLALSLLGLAVAGVLGVGAIPELRTGGFTNPQAPSARAAAVLTARFPTAAPNLVLVVDPVGTASIDAPSVTAAARTLVHRIAATNGVSEVRSYWTVPPAARASLRARDGGSALITAQVSGSNGAQTRTFNRLHPVLIGAQQVLRVRAGGPVAVNAEITAQVGKDLARAESIAVPVTALLLVLVFGSAIAALLPLAVSVVAIVGALAVLRMVAAFTPVSVFSLNLTTGLGLGLGIDYSLFILARYREERRTGAASATALTTTLRTAGRTVLLSGATVAGALSTLLVFPLYFLRSFAYAGIAVVIFAVVGALLVLPALLALLGDRVNAGDVRPVLHRLFRLGAVSGPPQPDSGFWYDVAVRVTRRPLLVAGGALALLAVFATPLLSASFSLPDQRVLPAAASAHAVGDTLARQYSAGQASPLTILPVAAREQPIGGRAALAAYSATLSRLAGTAVVYSPVGSYRAGRQITPAPQTGSLTGGYLQLVPSVPANSAAAQALVRAVRATPAPFPVLVAGESAQLVDTKQAIGSRLPLAVALVAAVTALAVFSLTGSVLLPLKAIAANLVSLGATMGVLVWGFQEGHLAGLLGFTRTGELDTTTPLLVCVLVFGLSMDYEMFLLSRITEEHRAGRVTTEAVARGLARTGRLISAAAALLAVVFLAFVTSGVTFIQLLGVGVGFAVALDATVIRGALVPATMRLAGRWNWWAPRPLTALHRRIGWEENAHQREVATPADIGSAG